MPTNRYDSTRQWYAIHTYSGYEEKVADSIRQRINAVDMADKIFDVMVPKEKQIEIKNGKRKVVEKKIFQGYALVEMVYRPQYAWRYRIRWNRHDADTCL
jgi:transcriptional antiterminator NusG